MDLLFQYMGSQPMICNPDDRRHPGCEKWRSNWSLLTDIETETLGEGGLVGAVCMYMPYIGVAGI